MRRFLFWSLLLSGCSSSSMSGVEKSGAADVDGLGSDTASDSGGDAAVDESPENSQDSDVPAWFALDAEIEMLNGLARSISLGLRVYGDDPSEGELEDCSLSVNVDLFASEATTPDPLIQHWWSLNSFTALEDWNCGEVGQLPLSVAIGLGEFHPELNGHVLPLDVSDPSAFLYGFYGALDFAPALDGYEAGSTYILGYGSTESTLAQLEEVTLDGALPDGVYDLVGVFLLPILP